MGSRAGHLLWAALWEAGPAVGDLSRYGTDQVYKGYFQEGLRHGFGVLESTLQAPQYCKYTGHWKKGQRCGYGIEEDGDRSVLHGPPGWGQRDPHRPNCLKSVSPFSVSPRGFSEVPHFPLTPLVISGLRMREPWPPDCGRLPVLAPLCAV